MPQHLRFKTIWFIYFFLSISLHTIDLLLVRRGMMLSSAESYNMCRLKENVTTTVKAFGEPIPMPRWHRQRGLTLHSYWGERRNPDLRPLFLVARSDSRRTDFNERALELRNCRKRRPLVARVPSFLALFRHFATGEGSRLVLRGSLARLFVFLPSASSSHMRCEMKNAFCGWINWLIVD